LSSKSGSLLGRVAGHAWHVMTIKSTQKTMHIGMKEQISMYILSSTTVPIIRDLLAVQRTMDQVVERDSQVLMLSQCMVLGLSLKSCLPDGGESCWPNLQLTIRDHDDGVISVVFSPDGKRIASGSSDKTICLWDAETGLQLGSPLTGHTGPVCSVAFSPDGKRIASGYDKTICLWDTETGLQLGSPLTGHTDSVHSVAFSPNGQRVVSGSADNTIHMSDGPTDAVVNLHFGNIPRHPSHSLCYSSNPSHTLLDSNVYIPGSDFNVRTLLELDSGGWIVSPKGHLLLWIPSYMPRPSLYSPFRLFVIGKHINLDLSMMVHGFRWIEYNYGVNIQQNDCC